MCLGLAGRVVATRAEPDLVDVEIAGVVRPINAALLEGVLHPGDWILIHSGFALERMTSAEAHEAMAMIGGPGMEEMLDGE